MKKHEFDLKIKYKHVIYTKILLFRCRTDRQYIEFKNSSAINFLL